jgi:hypothetical protein
MALVAGDITGTALPFVFAALTVTPTVEPTSARVSVYVEVVAPSIAAQLLPLVPQRTHW